VVEQIAPLRQGVQVVYGAGVEKRRVDADAAFFAVGWPGNADHIDAAAAGVAINGGYAEVDEYLRTSVPHIFAAGDVDGHTMLVSSAIHEGRVAGENAVLGPHRRVVRGIVPAGSFTDPEYASVGLTEEAARAQYDCAVALVRYENLLRPVADGQPEGFCKLIVETGGRQIVGAHVLGEYSAEVIQMVAACMAAGMRVEEIAELELAFPTFTEGVAQAAQMLVRELGVRPMPQMWWSSLSASEAPVAPAR
jgi:pyruvate/2-oxoglutarate dehydrogenase complex dihydrolipoamide dehydrogenase (E3) component